MVIPVCPTCCIAGVLLINQERTGIVPCSTQRLPWVHRRLQRHQRPELRRLATVYTGPITSQREAVELQSQRRPRRQTRASRFVWELGLGRESNVWPARTIYCSDKRITYYSCSILAWARRMLAERGTEPSLLNERSTWPRWRWFFPPPLDSLSLLRLEPFKYDTAVQLCCACIQPTTHLKSLPAQLGSSAQTDSYTLRAAQLRGVGRSY